MQSDHVEPVAYRPTVIVVLGVSGAGKSTVGSLLAARLGWPFEDADDLHAPQSRARMAAGHRLTDQERGPWLRAVAHWMDERLRAGESAVVACSALKRAYRDVLRDGRPEVQLLYLRGSRELIAKRLSERHGHFFPAGLLDSQFADLEEPSADEQPWVAPLTDTPEAIVGAVLERLRTRRD
ncbi:carbohydrate kinase (thermoresistant glucokinase family) [Kitasatospora sp. MAP12-15]|uniref:gluconokinase n=1 Tax=unclassified Kitasatospora TaxID=2633591 RepID=UPI00247330A1|nr:gluconokinase [Kitasatospora sp. MAP12-44]MDH6109316.1 carbohydrate kinase (thermoresistant glucokinase family) [Kitasatospora sp. MAP12-44]